MHGRGLAHRVSGATEPALRCARHRRAAHDGGDGPGPFALDRDTLDRRRHRRGDLAGGTRRIAPTSATRRTYPASRRIRRASGWFPSVAEGARAVVARQIGGASGRERGCQYVEISVGGGYIKKKKNKQLNMK